MSKCIHYFCLVGVAAAQIIRPMPVDIYVGCGLTPRTILVATKSAEALAPLLVLFS